MLASCLRSEVSWTSWSTQDRTREDGDKETICRWNNGPASKVSNNVMKDDVVEEEDGGDSYVENMK